MSNWTRYEVLQEDGTVVYHIAPSANGQLLAPHSLRPDCGCKPFNGIHTETGQRAFIHNDPRRSMH